MEYIEPLREALEQVTGDAKEISAISQSWHRMAAELKGAADTYAAKLGEVDWRGSAAEAYNRTAREIVEGMDAVAAQAADLAEGIAYAGIVVATVRAIVFDIIATFISRIIAEALMAAAAAAPSLGASMAAFMTAFMADLAIQVARIVKLLGRLLKKIGEFVRKFRALGQSSRTTANNLMHRGNRLLRDASKRTYDANKTLRNMTQPADGPGWVANLDRWTEVAGATRVARAVGSSTARAIKEGAKGEKDFGAETGHLPGDPGGGP